MKRILGWFAVAVVTVAAVLMTAAHENTKRELRDSQRKEEQYWRAFQAANDTALDFYRKLQVARARQAVFVRPDDLPAAFEVAHDGDGFPYLDVDGIPLRFDAQQRLYVHNHYPDESLVGRVLFERTNGAWTLQREKLYDGCQYRLTETGWLRVNNFFR